MQQRAQRGVRGTVPLHKWPYPCGTGLVGYENDEENAQADFQYLNGCVAPDYHKKQEQIEGEPYPFG